MQSLPIHGKKFQISTGGGGGPQWVSGGKEIGYFSAPDRVMGMQVQTSPTFQAGKSRLWFKTQKNWLGSTGAPDGQRNLVTVPVGDTPRPTYAILLNWTQALKH